MQRSLALFRPAAPEPLLSLNTLRFRGVLNVADPPQVPGEEPEAMLAGLTKELWDFERLYDEAMAA